MKIKLFCGIAAMAMALIGCSSATFYKDRSWSEMPKTVKVIYDMSECESLKGLSEDDVNAAISEKIFVESGKSVSASAKAVPKDSIGTLMVKLGENDFAAPSYGNMDEADVYLVLDSLTSGSKGVYNPQASFMFNATYSQATISAKYAIYDAKAKKIVAYGTKTGEVKGINAEGVLHNLIGNILSYTPISFY